MKRARNNSLIYFDNAATTKPYSSVLETFQMANEKFWANPHSLHKQGERAEQLLEQARTQLSTLLDASTYTPIFTSGATESNNLAIRGVCDAYSQRGKYIITSSVEHPSVRVLCQYLQTVGYEVTFLPVNSSGSVELDSLKKALRDDTILVAIMTVNNETGAINDVEKLAKFTKLNSRAHFLVDAVQAVGKIPLTLKDSSIDFLSISAHKFGGIKGSGALLIKNGINLQAQLIGGGQEGEVRSGTADTARAASIAKALRISLENKEEKYRAIKLLNKKLKKALLKDDKIIINSTENGSPYILNFSVLGVKPETLLHALSGKEIYISTVSACSSKKSEESIPVFEMTKDMNRALSTIRVSFSSSSTELEVDEFIDAFWECLEKIR
jgi:cysteine desulfurase